MLYSATLLFWDLLAFMRGAFACDDGCTYVDAQGRPPSGTSWRFIADAWQWKAMQALSIVAAVGLGISLIIIARRRTRHLTPWALLVATVLTTIPWMIYLLEVI